MNNPVLMYRMSKTTAWSDSLFKGMCPISDLMIIMVSGCTLLYHPKGVTFLFLYFIVHSSFPRNWSWIFYCSLQMVDPRKERIGQMCKACGYNGSINMQHRLITFICKNPPNESATTPSKKWVIIKISLCPCIVL